MSVGNFSKDDKTVNLNIDWKVLGFDPAKVTASTPKIEKFQDEAQLSPSAPVSIASKNGFLIVYSANE